MIIPKKMQNPMNKKLPDFSFWTGSVAGSLMSGNLRSNDDFPQKRLAAGHGPLIGKAKDVRSIIPLEITAVQRTHGPSADKNYREHPLRLIQRMKQGIAK